MTFVKGVSGNPKGRPKAVKTNLKKRVEALIEGGLAKIQNDIDNASPEERQHLVLQLTGTIRANSQK